MPLLPQYADAPGLADYLAAQPEIPNHQEALNIWAAAGNPLVKKKPTTTKIPMPKTDAPPLELNLKAKMNSPWTSINTIQEYDEFTHQGFYLEHYSPVTGEWHPTNPVEHPFTTLGKKNTRVANGIRKHHTKKVRVFAPVKRKHIVNPNVIVVDMYSGRSMEDAASYRKAIADRFITWMAPFQWVIWDSENDQLGF